MPATFSDVLLAPAATIAGQWIQVVNNATGVGYVSTGPTTSPTGLTGGGVYTFNPGPPGGIYTVYTSPVQLAPLAGGWNATGNTNYVIAYTAGDDMVMHSGTAKQGSPYTPSALAVALAGVGGVMGTSCIFAPPKGGGLDDSANMQALIDALSAYGGGEILGDGAYTANVVLKSGVSIGATPRGLHVPGHSGDNFSISAFTTGYVIDTPITQVTNCGVRRVTLYGLGGGTPGGGIRYRYVYSGHIQSVGASNFADEGVALLSQCQINTIDDLWIQNSLLNTTRVAPIGGLDVDGTDHYIKNVVVVSAATGISSASLYCSAIVLRGSGYEISNIDGGEMDNGAYITGTRIRVVNSRMDNNWGHGWNVIGGGNQFSNSDGLDNGLAASNTYDNWRADAASGNNLYVGCASQTDQATLPKYGYEDLYAGGVTNRNWYVNCRSLGAVGTAAYVNQSTGGGGSAFVFPAGTMSTLTANSATPDVTGYERFITANSSPTTITNFINAVHGQRLVIFCNDSNTTIQHNGSSISLHGAGNKKLLAGVFYEFELSGVWREVRSYPFSVSADNGDAAKTIKADLDESTQIWASPLTVNRAVSVSFGGTSGAYIGAKFRIVRKASATGASTLDVGTGPLKSLAPGQWCDIECDGAAWFLSAFGSL